MVTDLSQLDLNKNYSYADYLTWQLKERVELIMGRLFKMTPAPSLRHQKISGNLFREISLQFKGKNCQVIHPPFDVRIPKGSTSDNDVFTVLQPDLTIVCDEKKLDSRGCIGAPDLVVEILSPSTADKDLHEKFDIYEEGGVKEYWIVEPNDWIVNVFILDAQGHYTSEKPKSRKDKLHSVSIPGLAIDLQEIFPLNLEEPEEVYEKEIRIDP
jgi:Uma2 family endonuclease